MQSKYQNSTFEASFLQDFATRLLSYLHPNKRPLHYKIISL